MTNLVVVSVTHVRAESQMTLSCIGNPLPPLSKLNVDCFLKSDIEFVEYSTTNDDIPVAVLMVVLMPSIVADPHRVIDSPWSLIAEAEQPAQDWSSLFFHVTLKMRKSEDETIF